jgi:metal-responsive CopG/Arc/MetJ family transcriptional regulator
MSTRSLSANQLAVLSALIATPATKAKASITLSGNLLKVIDSLAGAAQRSAWIERAVQSYATRQLKERRRERELALLTRHADELNSEGDDSVTYQANWTAE